jgi:hypothetical protein
VNWHLKITLVNCNCKIAIVKSARATRKIEKKCLKNVLARSFAIVELRSTKTLKSGLPDFYWYNIPKRGENMPNNHEIYRKATKCIQYL